MNILFFDTETTGLPLNYKAHVHEVDNWPRVIQLAAMLFSVDIDDDDAEPELLSASSHIITPYKFEIPEESSKIHGITTENAIADGVPLDFVLGKMAGLMGAVVDGLLVGHNLSFDRHCLGAEFIRCGYETEYEATKLPKRYCTMMKTITLCNLLQAGSNRKKFPQLQELHKHLFDSEFDGAHDALADIEATARCFFELIKTGHAQY